MTSRRAQRRRELDRRAPTLAVVDREAAGALAVREDGMGALELAVEEAHARYLAGLLATPALCPCPWAAQVTQQGRRIDLPAGLQRWTVPGGGHPGRCFEDALRFLVRHADVAPGARLLHGWVCEATQTRGLRLPWVHAWVEIDVDGEPAAWCPTTGYAYELGSWDEVLTPAKLCAHTLEDATGQALSTGMYGPWRGCADRLQAAVDTAVDLVRQANPELDRWLERMLDEDPGFARAWIEWSAEGVYLLRAVLGFHAHPDAWQGRGPGEVPLHPLGWP